MATVSTKQIREEARQVVLLNPGGIRFSALIEQVCSKLPAANRKTMGAVPSFQIRVRAQRFSPDMFYVNDFASRLHGLDASKFQRLFG